MAEPILSKSDTQSRACLRGCPKNYKKNKQIRNWQEICIDNQQVHDNENGSTAETNTAAAAVGADNKEFASSAQCISEEFVRLSHLYAGTLYRLFFARILEYPHVDIANSGMPQPVDNFVENECTRLMRFAVRITIEPAISVSLNGLMKPIKTYR